MNISPKKTLWNILGLKMLCIVYGVQCIVYSVWCIARSAGRRRPPRPTQVRASDLGSTPASACLPSRRGARPAATLTNLIVSIKLLGKGFLSSLISGGPDYLFIWLLGVRTRSLEAVVTSSAPIMGQWSCNSFCRDINSSLLLLVRDAYQHYQHYQHYQRYTLTPITSPRNRCCLTTFVCKLLNLNVDMTVWPRLTCGVLVDGDLPGVLPAPHHLRLRRARGDALQRHVAALGLHHVRAAQAVHDPGRHWAVAVSVYEVYIISVRKRNGKIL